MLWGEHDAQRERRDVHRALAVAAGIVIVWVGLTMTSYSWHELIFVQPDPTSPPRIAVPLADAECHLDDDCTLMPALITCCGECDPAPPYEAVPRALLDEVRLVTNEDCAPHTRLCDPPACSMQVENASPSVICRGGRCEVQETEPRASR